MENGWNIHGVLMEYWRNTNATCMEYLWNIGGISMEYAWNNEHLWMESGKNIGGIQFFGWIGMAMHEYAWMDKNGYGGIWIRVDGCK